MGVQYRERKVYHVSVNDYYEIRVAADSFEQAERIANVVARGKFGCSVAEATSIKMLPVIYEEVSE